MSRRVGVEDIEAEEIGRGIFADFVVLRDTSVTDEGLKHLSELKRLRKLQIVGGDFGDSALPYVAALRQVESIERLGRSCTA